MQESNGQGTRRMPGADARNDDAEIAGVQDQRIGRASSSRPPAEAASFSDPTRATTRRPCSMTTPSGPAVPTDGADTEAALRSLRRAEVRENAGQSLGSSPVIRMLARPPASRPGPAIPVPGLHQAASAGDPARWHANLVRTLQRTSRLASALVILGGLLVLLGWQLDLRYLQAIGPVDVVMNPLAALLFVLIGSALLLGERNGARGLSRLSLVGCGSVAALCGGLVLMRSVAGWQVGVDEWLFGAKVRNVDPPDWMAANSALNFLFLGLALLAGGARTGGGWRPAYWLVLPTALTSLLVVTGYLYNAAGLTSFQLQLPMALNTALFFLAVCFALVAAHPNEGAMALFVSDSAGGTITRRLLPALLLVPLVLGVLVNTGVRFGWYGPTVGLALLTLATIVLSVLLTTTTAGALHRSDLALRRSEEHFRRIIENAYDMVLVMDGAGTITYASPSAQRVLGSAPEELTGRSGFSLLHPDDVDTAVARTTETAATPGTVVSAELRLRHRDGSYRILETFCRTLASDSAASGIVVNARDATERTRYEEDLRQAVEAAEMANRAKSEFLSRMSHELRTPMNSILGFGQLLARKDLPPDHRKGVDYILKAGEHLLNLINEVLEISSIEAGRQTFSLEPVHVATVLQETRALIQPLASQRGLTLGECDADPRLHVHADRQRLVQILLNLLANAVKYNRLGGSVSMVCEERQRPDGALAVAIGVRDTGPGIVPDDVARLFIPFERLGAGQSDVEGTGLGLALSRRLVEAMGGTLTVDTRVGEGSTFWVELSRSECPIATAGLEGDRLADAADPAGNASPATILYIEDNLPNLALVTAILAERPNISLLSSVQGRMGLDLAAEHSPQLILLDMHLPDLRGDEVLRRLRQNPRTRGIPVVIVSADATGGSVERLTDAGASGYLTKPLDVAEFLATIDRLLPPDRDVNHDR
jgi:PAS domain S-box-containing protein